jgi:hypothetical protein
MPLPAPVAKMLVETIQKNVGPISKKAAQTLIQIVIEYAPKAQAQAAIMRAVARILPWAVGIMSSAFAFVLIKTGLKENIRLGIETAKGRLALEGNTSQKRKRSKNTKVNSRPQKNDIKPTKKLLTKPRKRATTVKALPKKTKK